MKQEVSHICKTFHLSSDPLFVFYLSIAHNFSLLGDGNRLICPVQTVLDTVSVLTGSAAPNTAPLSGRGLSLKPTEQMRCKGPCRSRDARPPVVFRCVGARAFRFGA